VMNNTLSAYVIMFFFCLQEVFLFLLSLFFFIFAFSSATLTLFQINVNFKDIPAAALSYLEMALQLFGPTQYNTVHQTVLILIMLVLFQISVYIFLINLLIAQLCSTHQAYYQDILGYARLQRILTIYATMPYVPVQTWTRWIESLMLDQKLEFGVGDIGLAGGMQTYEAANLNPITQDSILRVGGSTSPKAQWPEEAEEGGEGEGVARLERMMTRMMQSMDRKTHKKGKGAGGSSAMGSSGLGEGAAGSDTGSGVAEE